MLVVPGLAMALACGRRVDMLVAVAWSPLCSTIVEILSALHSSAAAWRPSGSYCLTYCLSQFVVPSAPVPSSGRIHHTLRRPPLGLRSSLIPSDLLSWWYVS